jgi:hypothetical protein
MLSSPRSNNRGWVLERLELIFDVADVMPSASVMIAVRLNVSDPETPPSFPV